MRPSAAVDQAADIGEPFHFGPEQGLYGVLHGAVADAHEAVLVCAPLGHEYLRAHFVLQRFARRLAARGVPVLRFDYYGCRDALGDSAEATCSRWQQDIECAFAELERRTRARRIVAVGVRLGATLLKSVSDRIRPSALVLWDPIEHAGDYFAELERAHRMYQRSSSVWPWRVPRLGRPRRQELLGTSYSASFLREVRQLTLPNESALGCAVRCHRTDLAWLDLEQLEDMFPDTGLSRSLEHLVHEAA